MLITKADEQGLQYVHARAWSEEGTYGHGVARGEIRFTDTTKPLLSQRWQENSRAGADNETYLEAAGATTLEIRRLNL